MTGGAALAASPGFSVRGRCRTHTLSFASIAMLEGSPSFHCDGTFGHARSTSKVGRLRVCACAKITVKRIKTLQQKYARFMLPPICWIPLYFRYRYGPNFSAWPEKPHSRRPPVRVSARPAGISHECRARLWRCCPVPNRIAALLRHQSSRHDQRHPRDAPRAFQERTRAGTRKTDVGEWS